MKTKTFPANYKAGPALIEDKGDDAGFEAIVAVFNNVDRVGDIVRPGAFADSIAAWAKSGDTLPVLWSHRMDDPHYNIGAVKQIEELTPGDARIPAWASPWVKENGGLWIKADLDAGEEASPIARQVRYLLKHRRVTQFSFAYEVLDERPGAEPGTNELLKLWIYEAGPTPIGANPLTELVGAKAGDPPGETPEPEAPAESETTAERGPSASLLRIQCEIAALLAEHDD